MKKNEKIYMQIQREKFAYLRIFFLIKCIRQTLNSFYTKHFDYSIKTTLIIWQKNG